MEITYNELNTIAKEYGQSYYILDTRQFELNYKELLQAFRKIYPNSHIAYSYKTNYIPKLCKKIDNLGGFAEIVSDMEYKIARKLEVNPNNIFFNGPYKDPSVVEELLLNSGNVNIDSINDLKVIKSITSKYPDKKFEVGIRCNFDIKDGVISRFGFDGQGEEMDIAVNTIRETSNLSIKGLHCHFASRNIKTWPNRVDGILSIVSKYYLRSLKYISLGGGLYGKMPDSLKQQFIDEIPTYENYADAVVPKFRDYFIDIPPVDRPKLIIEPGSALVGDAMKFAAKVVNIKSVRGKIIATLLGSIYNINPTLNKKNPPIKVYHENCQELMIEYNNVDFGGYTCIESDYLYKGYSGKLAVGDYVIFDNVGSYSVVLKPPFILPNFAIVEYDDISKTIDVTKRKESFEDLFNTFVF